MNEETLRVGRSEADTHLLPAAGSAAPGGRHAVRLSIDSSVLACSPWALAVLFQSMRTKEHGSSLCRLLHAAQQAPLCDPGRREWWQEYFVLSSTTDPSHCAFQGIAAINIYTRLPEADDQDPAAHPLHVKPPVALYVNPTCHYLPPVQPPVTAHRSLCNPLTAQPFQGISLTTPT